MFASLQLESNCYKTNVEHSVSVFTEHKGTEVCSIREALWTATKSVNQFFVWFLAIKLQKHVETYIGVAESGF
jgi:hypothetical protein